MFELSYWSPCHWTPIGHVTVPYHEPPHLMCIECGAMLWGWFLIQEEPDVVDL